MGEDRERLLKENTETKETNRKLGKQIEAAGNGMLTMARAAAFAAAAHKGQTRKDAGKTPYVNHLAEVVRILAEEGGVTNLTVLVAGYLHDAIEDVGVTSSEIEREFGAEVLALVEAVSDDKTLSKDRRKQLQIDHAPDTPPLAIPLKLADKIATVRDLVTAPPADWDKARQIGYLTWAKQVVDALPSTEGAATRLRRRFDEAYTVGFRALVGD